MNFLDLLRLIYFVLRGLIAGRVAHQVTLDAAWVKSLFLLKLFISSYVNALCFTEPLELVLGL